MNNDEQGEMHLIANASCTLSDHKKNYSPFLLEMLACCWGIEHFDVHLRGRKFVVYSDHRPPEKFSCMHQKMLSRLEHKMTEQDFVIQYKKGPKCQQISLTFLPQTSPCYNNVMNLPMQFPNFCRRRHYQPTNTRQLTSPKSRHPVSLKTASILWHLICSSGSASSFG